MLGQHSSCNSSSMRAAVNSGSAVRRWRHLDGRLTFAANKVFKQAGNGIAPVMGTPGEIYSRLAFVDCALWHGQENVHEFDEVPPVAKHAVVNEATLLNLEPTERIDAIDRVFRDILAEGRSKTGRAL